MIYSSNNSSLRYSHLSIKNSPPRRTWQAIFRRSCEEILCNIFVQNADKVLSWKKFGLFSVTSCFDFIFIRRSLQRWILLFFVSTCDYQKVSSFFFMFLFFLFQIRFASLLRKGKWNWGNGKRRLHGVPQFKVARIMLQLSFTRAHFKGLSKKCLIVKLL